MYAPDVCGVCGSCEVYGVWCVVWCGWSESNGSDSLGPYGLPAGLAFERSHTILGLRGGVHTPSGGVNTAGVHTGSVVFTQKKWCSHSVLQHIPVDGWCVDRSERF
jgi:hypothetical protein